LLAAAGAQVQLVPGEVELHSKMRRPWESPRCSVRGRRRTAAPATSG
jgi:hypothetical protein